MANILMVTILRRALRENMTYSYRFLDGAQADYEGIVAYLLSISDGPSAAQNFVDEFDKQINLVCSNPELYRLSRLPELAALGYRTMLVNKYIALYSFRQETVIVAHIFHQKQDYARLVCEHQNIE